MTSQTPQPKALKPEPYTSSAPARRVGEPYQQWLKDMNKHIWEKVLQQAFIPYENAVQQNVEIFEKASNRHFLSCYPRANGLTPKPFRQHAHTLIVVSLDMAHACLVVWNRKDVSKDKHPHEQFPNIAPEIALAISSTVYE